MKWLKLKNLIELDIWFDDDFVKPISDTKFKFPLVKLKQVLQLQKEFIKINDKSTYKRCRVQFYSKGIELRDTVKGSEIKTKRQQICRENQLLVAEIDAKLGGYGIVPKNLDGAIVSSHYFLYTINKEKLLPSFFELYLKTQEFHKQIKPIGSTNYAAIRSYHVLDYQIPLPPLSTQAKIATNYKKNVAKADELEQKAGEVEVGIETYLLDKLGIEIQQKELKATSYLQIIKFKELSRWDYDYALNQTTGIFYSLANAKYPNKRLGDIYNFVNQGWSKHKHQDETFRYIEIGSVDSFIGITEFTEIQTPNAPSRATQLIKENDLIVGLIRPYLKKFSIVSKKYNDYVCSSGFQVISSSENYNLEFLLEFLKSEAGVKQFEFYMTGALYPAITTKQFQDMIIPLPPISIQTEIVSHIREQKSEIKYLKNEAKQLRKAATDNFEKEVFYN